MRSRPASDNYLFSFLLPQGARAFPGAVVDSSYLCFVDIGRAGLVSITGPSREAVFDQAARILKAGCEGLPTQSIAGTLYERPCSAPGDGRDWLRLPGPADSWSVIVNAEVAFSPSGLGHHIPNLARAARPMTASGIVKDSGGR